MPADTDYFERSILVHLDAAYNLARWLTGDGEAAADVVQEACVRALRGLSGLSGPNPRAWFMAIVRNQCFDWLNAARHRLDTVEYDESFHGAEGAHDSAEADASRSADARAVHAAIAALPIEFREAIVLRELAELSYKEISAVVGVPIGTVMSRISRGRDLLALALRGDSRRQAS